MEGINEYSLYWLIYLAGALIGIWCWHKLFFWMPAGSDIKRFIVLLGCVLLLVPAPISDGAGYYAPALIVVPFTLLTVGLDASMYAINWYLGGLFIGVAILLLMSIVQRQTRTLDEKENES